MLRSATQRKIRFFTYHYLLIKQANFAQNSLSKLLRVNYSGIVLLWCMAAKVYERILNNRLWKHIEPLLKEILSIQDNIFTVKQVISKYETF